MTKKQTQLAKEWIQEGKKLPTIPTGQYNWTHKKDRRSYGEDATVGRSAAKGDKTLHILS